MVWILVYKQLIMSYSRSFVIQQWTAAPSEIIHHFLCAKNKTKQKIMRQRFSLWIKLEAVLQTFWSPPTPRVSRTLKWNPNKPETSLTVYYDGGVFFYRHWQFNILCSSADALCQNFQWIHNDTQIDDNCKSFVNVSEIKSFTAMTGQLKTYASPSFLPPKKGHI